MRSTIGNLWTHRGLIQVLTASTLKRIHLNTVFGYVWWLLDPILMTGVYTLVVAVIRRRGGMVPAYPAFVMCGILSWKTFASTITQSITAITASEGLIKSFTFPRAVLPLSLAFSSQVLFCFALIPLAGLTVFYEFVMKQDVHLGGMVVFVPVILAVQTILCVGGALTFSCFGAFFRDLSQLMTHVLRMGWFMSPGLYPITFVLKDYTGLAHVDWSNWRSLFVLNPLAHVIEAYRATILHNTMPDLAGLGYALGVGVAGVVFGFWVFRSQEQKFAKVI